MENFIKWVINDVKLAAFFVCMNIFYLPIIKKIIQKAEENIFNNN